MRSIQQNSTSPTAKSQPKMGNVTIELHTALVTALVHHVRGDIFVIPRGVPGELLHQELGYIDLHDFQPL